MRIRAIAACWVALSVSLGHARVEDPTLCFGVSTLTLPGESFSQFSEGLERALKITDTHAFFCKQQTNLDCPLYSESMSTGDSACTWRSSTQFCASASKSCQQLHGEPSCYVPSGEGKSLYRFCANLCRTRILKDMFQRYKSVRAKAAARCCHGKGPVCFGKMRKINLKVSLDPNPDNDNAWYSYNMNSIYFFPTTITGHLTPQTLEFTLFHELGHACQQALDGEKDSATQTMHYNPENPTDCNNPGLATTGYSKLGPGVANCILKKLEDTARQWKISKPLCQTQWRAEAFADAIFAKEMLTEGHWAWSCNNNDGDGAHAPRSVYMECLISGTFASMWREAKMCH